MKMKFNLNAAAKETKEAVENYAGVENLSIDMNVEVEYSVEEFLALIKFQKEMLPELKKFFREMIDYANGEVPKQEKEIEDDIDGFKKRWEESQKRMSKTQDEIEEMLKKLMDE